MAGGLGSIAPSVAILGTFAVAAAYLTVYRPWIADDPAALGRASRVAAGAVVVQTAHFSEELATGFHQRFPALFGLPPMSLSFFVSFNVFWLVVWALSTWGLARRTRAALFPLWFLGIGCVANGVGHPAFALVAGGYFPGLVTSPVAGVVGLLLVQRLLDVTHRAKEL